MADDEKEKNDQGNSDDVGDILFYPPLYQQRYSLAVKFLEEKNVKTMVDFGCAECKLLPLVRRIPCIEEVNGVDIDRDLLLTRHYILKPLLADYLCPRELPLRISLYEGSISRYDSRLEGIQAVTMVEIIEHLTEDVLADFVPVLFGQYQPEFILITTPNSEFNVLFKDFSGMRHDDHKFEWTRAEFQSWCTGVCNSYPYEVEYGGVGNPPKNRQDVGHCSQYAVFTRKNPRIPPNDTEVFQDDRPYDLVLEMEYPRREKLGEDAAILLEATYYIRQTVIQRRFPQQQLSDEENDDEVEDDTADGFYITLDDILNNHRVKILCTDISKLRNILAVANFVMSEDGTRIYVHDEEEEIDLDDNYRDAQENLNNPCADDAENEWTSERSEENWSDGEDDHSKTVSQIIPYSVMWADAEEDWSEALSNGNHMTAQPDLPSVLDTDPDMIWVPAVLHAPAVSRQHEQKVIIEGKFDDNWNGNLAHPFPTSCSGVEKGAAQTTERTKLDIPVADGQFDDIDDEQCQSDGEETLSTDLRDLTVS